MDEMMELFKQVQINLPLLDAIQQVPAYAKFLKDLCTTKRKLKTHIPKTVHLTKQVSAVLSNKLPPKLKDPGAPLISCKIGNLQIDRDARQGSRRQHGMERKNSLKKNIVASIVMSG
ncbi:hypothetical protein CFOL_v3_23986 [Cephalotus follicularis]|uniref:Retrotransposon gag protein n=1 Tax=Cephalotus follicularis TaxID=3775 RepID=A0A1Q3CJY6_CEPFO|nr:hypothetical protein CFOL_v3_23986 [Cephalotus follicularis]